MQFGIIEHLNYEVYLINLTVAAGVNPPTNNIILKYALDDLNNLVVTYRTSDGTDRNFVTETTASIKLKLGAASNITDGYLTAAHWAVFNNKQAALGYVAENTAYKGSANGYAPLDGTGKISALYLPSYVDDVEEYPNFAALPQVGETGKIYIMTDEAELNAQYRWSGSQYIDISKGISIGTTSSSAFRGDYGLVAYQHANSTGNAHGLTLADLNIGNIDNTSDEDKPLSATMREALDGKVNTSFTISGHDLTSNLTLVADDVGLGNVTNDAQVCRTEMGAVSGVATLDTDARLVQQVNAGSIVGVLNISNIPNSAIERMYPVSTDEDRFALTSNEVQNGDTVKVNQTGYMFLVIDDTQLDTDAGYEVYKAGVASAIEWTGILHMPTIISNLANVNAIDNDFLVKINGVWTNQTATQVNVLLALNNVDNTSDADKPISSAVSTALANKVDNTLTINSKMLNTNITLNNVDIGLGSVTNDAQVKRTEMGSAHGVATLDNNAKLLLGNMPGLNLGIAETVTVTAHTQTIVASGNSHTIIVAKNTVTHVDEALLDNAIAEQAVVKIGNLPSEFIVGATVSIFDDNNTETATIASIHRNTVAGALLTNATSAQNIIEVEINADTTVWRAGDTILLSDNNASEEVVIAEAAIIADPIGMQFTLVDNLVNSYAIADNGICEKEIDSYDVTMVAPLTNSYIKVDNATLRFVLSEAAIYDTVKTIQSVNLPDGSLITLYPASGDNVSLITGGNISTVANIVTTGLVLQLVGSIWKLLNPPLSFEPETRWNRVDTWQTTPDNNHYPSEKLVFDNLGGKQFATTFTSADSTGFVWTSNVLTITHNLSKKLVTVVVADNNGNLINYPVTFISTSVLTITFPLAQVPIANSYDIRIH